MDDGAGRRRRVLKLLRPWADVFVPFSATCALEETAAAVQLRVKVTDHLWQFQSDVEHLGRPHHHQIRMREAIDLHRLALGLCPRLALFREQPLLESASAFIGIRVGDETAQALASAAATCRLHVTFDYTGMDTRSLEKHVLKNVLQVLRRGFVSNDATYSKVRAKLVGVLAAKDRLECSVAPLLASFKLTTPSQAPDDQLLAEDYFRSLEAMAIRIRGMALVTSRTLEIELRPIQLEVFRFYITHRVIEAAKAFAATPVQFECKRIVLDPHYVTCSEVELSSFLETLASEDCRVDVGFVPAEEIAITIDDHGQNRESLIRALFRAVEKNSQISHVNFRGTLLQNLHTFNREAIFSSFIESVLAREKAVKIIEVSPRIELQGDDMMILRTCVGSWRQANPHRSLRTKQVKIDTMDMHQTLINILLSSLEGVEAVTIDNGADMATPSSLVELSVGRFSCLHDLDLSNVMIGSMDILTSPRQPTLRSLKLTDMVLQDPASFMNLQLRSRSTEEKFCLPGMVQKRRQKQSDNELPS